MSRQSLTTLQRLQHTHEIDIVRAQMRIRRETIKIIHASRLATTYVARIKARRA